MATKTASATREDEPCPKESFAPRSWLGLSSTEVRVGLIVIVVSLVARFQALLPGYSIDDYHFVNEGMPRWLDPQALAQGRVLSHLLLAALARLGAAPRAAPLGTILLTVVLVAVGLWACRSWGLRNRFGESLIVVSCIALHPYQTEIFTFKTAALFFAIALAVALAALDSCSWSRARWLLSCCALTCALSIYQNVLNYLLLLMLFTLVFQLAECDGANRDRLLRLKSQFLLVLASGALYAASALAAGRLSGVPLAQRATFLRPDEVVGRAIAFGRILLRMYWMDEPIFPRACKMMLLLAFFTGLVAYATDSLLNRRVLARRAIALVLALLIGLPLCIGLQLLLHLWWPVPRVLVQTSIFSAGMIGIGYSFAKPVFRRVLTATLTIVGFSFVGINNQVFSDQLRVNMRDLATANRILMRIEALPEFDQIKGIVFNGGVWGFPSAIPTVQGDMNISAFYAAWANVEVMNELSGYAFTREPPEIVSKADSYCKTAPKWPAPKSVVKVDSAAVVCFARD